MWLLPLVPFDEVGEEVHGEGEDDGRVLLRADGVESLEVPQLHIFNFCITNIQYSICINY